MDLWSDAVYHGYEDEDAEFGASKHIKSDEDLEKGYMESFPRLAGAR